MASSNSFSLEREQAVIENLSDKDIVGVAASWVNRNLAGNWKNPQNGAVYRQLYAPLVRYVRTSVAAFFASGAVFVRCFQDASHAAVNCEP